MRNVKENLEFENFTKTHAVQVRVETPYGTIYNTAFKTYEDAIKYATLYRAWWGDNLVFLGVKEEKGLFYPAFNVFD